MVESPILDHFRLNTVLIWNCNFSLNEGEFDFPSNPVLNERHEKKSAR